MNLPTDWAPPTSFFHPREWTRPQAAPLVTSRNNSHVSESRPEFDPWAGPWRPVAAYVGACSTGTLALLYEGGRVVVGALPCGSWSCAKCRPRKAAQYLDRLRRGMESRPGMRRTLVTLTLDPFRFGAVRVGTVEQEDGRETAMVSLPTPEQFRRAALAMSREWDKLNKRLGAKAHRDGVERVGYFRVIELHRNGWPHYHVVMEHPTWGPAELRRQLGGWTLGRWDAREITLDAAVGEVAPYLTSAENKGNGSKAYQFAAGALPHGFRLVSTSRDFLAPAEIEERPIHGVVLRGHFSEYHRTLQELGADSRLCLNAPCAPDKEHRPPSRSVATGDAALVYYASLVDAKALHLSGTHARVGAEEVLGGSGWPNTSGRVPRPGCSGRNL